MQLSIVLTCLLFKTCLGIESYGLSFQEDGYMNDNSVNVWAKLSTDLPELTTFSICTWVKFTYERIFNMLWSYCNEVPTSLGDTNLVCSSIRFEPGIFSQQISEQGKDYNSSGLRQFRWNLICGSYLSQGDSRMVSTVYFNGFKLDTYLHDTPTGLNKWFSSGHFFLGQDQDSLGGSFEKQQSLSGLLSNINIWNRILTDKEVERMFKCFDSPMGDVLNWNQANWLLSNVKKIDLDTSDFCIDFPDKNYYMLPERRSLESGSEVCHVLGGSVATPLDKTENDLVKAFGVQFYNVCEAASQSGKTLWIGIEKDAEDKWIDIRTKERLSYQNFKEGHGKGNTNCVYMLVKTGSSSDGQWGSAVCSDQSPRRVCTTCEFHSKKSKFTLRGLCDNSRHDRVFTLESDGVKKPFFKGLSTSIIKWNETASHWHLDHLRYAAEGFLPDETLKEYPIGRKSWKIDDRLCEYQDADVTLTLTACGEDEFTCTDGTCQPLNNRCDLKADCLDRSDEEDCSKVILPKDYEMGLPPKHTIGGERVDDPLPVYLSVDIFNFDKIDTVNMLIAVMMRLNVTWKDRRVDFLNLRDDIYQNLVPEDKAAKMWKPQIGFDNAKTGKLDYDEHDILMIRRDSPPEPFDPSRSREDYVYEGYKNSLMYLRRYYAEYPCTFDLKFFPFDEQVCTMEFKARTVTKQYLKLMPGNLVYKGPKLLVEFEVQNITMSEGSTNVTRSEIKIVVKLARQSSFHLSQSMFPPLLLGFLAYLTFWIDIGGFTDRFMGSLTALLVLSSFMSTVSSSLPKTSTYKAIDLWLIFFLISTALNIAVHVLVDHFYQKEQKKKMITKHLATTQKQSSHGGVENGKITPLEINEKLFNIKNAEDSVNMYGNPASYQLQTDKSWWQKYKERMTAQGINDFQKTLFPVIFLTFLIFFACYVYFRPGE